MVTKLAKLIIEHPRRCHRDSPSVKARKDLQRVLPFAHFFECSSIYLPAWDLLGKDGSVTQMIRGLFLPFPVTWIEYTDDKKTVAVCFAQNDLENKAASFRSGIARFMCMEKGIKSYFCIGNVDFNLENDNIDIETNDGAFWDKSESMEQLARLFVVSCIMLALINETRVTQQINQKRRTRVPLGDNRPFGKWPLLGWKKVVLRIGEDVQTEPNNGRLTGRRALHWVRSHLRFVNGKIVIVRAHTRGDASLGMINTKYEVKT